MATANYVEPLGLYLMFQWYYVERPKTDRTEWVLHHIEHFHDIERNPYYRINLVEASVAVEPGGQ